jgi:hypothetical protein
MLVLAMEFSRGAQRAIRGVRSQETDRQRGGNSAGERPTFARRGSRRRVEGRNRLGLPGKTGTEGHSLKTE